ncbi:MAG TPA: DUF5107 domain-containing protein [Terriglobia bacterium]|nr:DUF5107 domain-containing protein [Terriglobia bacterium]
MKSRNLVRVTYWLGIILFGPLALTLSAQSTVKVWEEPLVVPTYLVGPADPNPIFYNGRVYQGAKGPMYPYPLVDKLTDNRQDKSYKAVYLENKYLKISVLPEMGGRIFSGVDKTDNYNFFYRQHVIKPALIGMVGAWISGGVEWNIPHHHRASTFLPVDYTLVENSDGSKTIWVGEIELRHRMKWLVGLTMYPDKSYLEASVRLINRTPLAHSMLYFANVAVHANPEYQVIFPPNTEWGTQHAKVEFVHWPIGKGIYAGVDYNGVDVSWWKSHPAPVSIFAWNFEDDFFGGYDHGQKAGVVHVADHNIVSGKKFFEFANGPEGFMWDKILTDTDGPYLELMAGAYSDNQPDYSWIQPHEIKSIKQYWYPIKELGGIKKANLDAAVNLDVDAQRHAKFGFNTTSEFRDAKVLLQAGGQILFEQRIEISPEKPFSKDLVLPEGIRPENLKVSLQSSAGAELVSYQPVKPRGEPMPKPVEPPPAPKDIKTNEELYLAGLRLEQFYNPAREPYPYYEEALRRDPGDSRANTALGILYLKRGLYAKAEESLKTAVERITRNYTRPKDGEALYYLGIAQRAQGKDRDALDAFNRAAWSQGWYSASNYALAEMACQDGDWSRALESIDRSIARNTVDTRAADLKATIHRQRGQPLWTEAITRNVIADDPLDFWARNEQWLALSKLERKSEAEKALGDLKTLMRNHPQSYLELAQDYANAGCLEDAIDVLQRLVDVSEDRNRIYPMVYYHLGYYSLQKGDPSKANEYYRLASQMSPDYCFPYQLESIGVLKAALQSNPRDARAAYYLGNLLYDIQPENAIAAWQGSIKSDPSFAIVHRNLALALARVKNDLPAGIASLEQAVQCDPKEPRFYAELDTLYEKASVPHQKRLALLEKNHETVLTRDDSLLREIGLKVMVGQYDQAIGLLENRHFHLWEGGDDELSNVHELNVDAHVLRGQESFRTRKYQEALKDFEAALDYPERFEMGRPYRGGREPQIYYLIGTAYEELGNTAKARESYQKSLEMKLGRGDHRQPLRYFQGLSYRKLGQETKAVQIFDELIRIGQQRLKVQSTDFFAKFGGTRSESAEKAQAHYLIALGYLGKKLTAQARQELETAHHLDINHLGVQTQLAALQAQK